MLGDVFGIYILVRSFGIPLFEPSSESEEENFYSNEMQNTRLTVDC